MQRRHLDHARDTGKENIVIIVKNIQTQLPIILKICYITYVQYNNKVFKHKIT